MAWSWWRWNDWLALYWLGTWWWLSKCSVKKTMKAWVTSFPTDLKIGSVFSTQQVFSSLWRQQDTCNHEKELHQVGHHWLDSKEIGADTCISCWDQMTIERSTVNRTTLSPPPRLRACCGERVDRWMGRPAMHRCFLGLSIIAVKAQ